MLDFKGKAKWDAWDAKKGEEAPAAASHAFSRVLLMDMMHACGQWTVLLCSRLRILIESGAVLST